MKKLLFLLLFIPCVIYSQDLSKTIDVDGISKNELYGNALTYFAENFVSANHVIQMQDPTSGRVIGKGNFKTDGKRRDIKIIIDVKDNKYRYTIEADPFIETKLYHIESINKLGAMVKGNTYIKYGYVDGVLVFNKEESYFECTGSCNKYRLYYTGKNEFLGLSKTAQIEWREKVDNYLASNIKLLLEDSSLDVDLISIIEELTKTMSKKDNW